MEESDPKGGLSLTYGFVALSSLTIRVYALQGQAVMVIGTAGDLPKAPIEPIQFLEGTSHCFLLDQQTDLALDMDDAALAEAVSNIASICLSFT